MNKTEDVFSKWECPECGSVQADRVPPVGIITTSCKNGHKVLLDVVSTPEGEFKMLWAERIPEPTDRNDKPPSCYMADPYGAEAWEADRKAGRLDE